MTLDIDRDQQIQFFVKEAYWSDERKQLVMIDLHTKNPFGYLSQISGDQFCQKLGFNYGAGQIDTPKSSKRIPLIGKKPQVLFFNSAAREGIHFEKDGGGYIFFNLRCFNSTNVSNPWGTDGGGI